MLRLFLTERKLILIDELKASLDFESIEIVNHILEKKEAIILEIEHTRN